MNVKKSPPQALFIIPFGLFFLLLGLLVGVFRLMYINGVPLPSFPLVALFSFHGELMVFGFVATVIMGESYAMLRGPIASSNLLLAAIALSVVGVSLKLAAYLVSPPPSPLNFVGGAILTVGLLLYLTLLLNSLLQKRERILNAFRSVAVAGLVIASGLLVSRPAESSPELVLLMLLFPVIIVIGERLSSSMLSEKFNVLVGGRVWPRAGMREALFIISLSILGTATLALYLTLLPLPPLPVAASLLYLTAVVLLILIERPRKQLEDARKIPGLYAFMVKHLMVAYIWLIIAFIALPAFYLRYSFLLYDAFIHSLAVGFIGLMIMGHGPLMIPLILGKQPLTKGLSYLPLSLIVAGNGIRVGGDFLSELGLQVSLVVGVSGILILLAILSYMAIILPKILRSQES